VKTGLGSVRLQVGYLVPNAVEFLLQGQFFETCERETEQQTDSAVQNHESIMESSRDLFGTSLRGGRVRHTPMRRHGLARPDGTDLLGGGVAHGKNKMQWRRIGLRELVPRFAAQSLGRKPREFQLPERLRMHETGRVAAGAVCNEIRKAFPLQDGLGHDGARRVPRAEKENVVACDHGWPPLENVTPTRQGQYIRIGTYMQGSSRGDV
jgi:hypothetical protein